MQTLPPGRFGEENRKAAAPRQQTDHLGLASPRIEPKALTSR
jgi:hypothetical protein